MNNNYTFYLPKVTPVATLLIVHGMAEHQGRYQPFAQFLANHDIAVLTFDHLGHGQQAYDNGCLGYMGNPNPAELLIDNVMEHAQLIAENTPTSPILSWVTVWGHLSFAVFCSAMVSDLRAQ